MSGIQVNSTSDNDTSFVMKCEGNHSEEDYLVSEHTTDDELSSLDAERRGVGKYWTTNKCIELIRLYRTKTLLWSTEDPNYYKMCMKKKAWKDLAKAFNISVLACKTKMNILQCSFRRERCRLKKSNGEYKSCWFAFREMSFLLNKNTKERAFKQNKSHKKNTQQLNEETDILDHDCEITETENVTNQTNDESKDKVEVINTDFVNFTNPTPDISINQITQVNNPETVAFLNFIGNKMKKYDDQTKLEAQQAICEVMFKLDRKFILRNREYTLHFNPNI